MRRWLAVAAGVAVVALGVGLWAFEPWRLFTDSTVDEALPVAVTVAPDAPSSSADPTTGAADSTDAAPADPVKPAEPVAKDEELARGRFEAAEHPTTGVARVLRLADGRRFVRLEGLATSDGPDLHVWLSDQPSGGSWGSYDDGRYVRLGELKANNGNQNYLIPADARIGDMTTVVIWCDRFNVAFGTAPVDL